MTNPQVKLKSKQIKTNHKEILNVKGSLQKNKFDKVTFETSFMKLIYCHEMVLVHMEHKPKYMHEINILYL